MTPDQLRQAFEKWLDDGADMSNDVSAPRQIFDEFILPLWRALDEACSCDEYSKQECGPCKAKADVMGRMGL